MIKSTHEMVFYMYYTVGWFSSNGNYSSGNPANKLSGFVGALLSKEITIGKEGGPCRHFVVYHIYSYNMCCCNVRRRISKSSVSIKRRQKNHKWLLELWVFSYSYFCVCVFVPSKHVFILYCIILFYNFHDFK